MGWRPGQRARVEWACGRLSHCLKTCARQNGEPSHSSHWGTVGLPQGLAGLVVTDGEGLGHGHTPCQGGALRADPPPPWPESSGGPVPPHCTMLHDGGPQSLRVGCAPALCAAAMFESTGTSRQALAWRHPPVLPSCSPAPRTALSVSTCSVTPASLLSVPALRPLLGLFGGPDAPQPRRALWPPRLKQAYAGIERTHPSLAAAGLPERCGPRLQCPQCL